MVAKRVDAGNSKPRRPPATTPEARENQMVALAFDLAEKQMIEGNASAQVITHFLKFGSQRAKLEEEKLRHENHLLATRAEQIASSARMEELYSKAIDAMREYTGNEVPDEDLD